MLATGLLVVHDTSGGGQDNETELTRRKELDGPVLDLTELNGVAGVDDTALVETAVELDDDLASAVVVNFLEFTDVAWKQEKELVGLWRRFKGLPNTELRKKREGKLVRSPPSHQRYNNINISGT